MTNDLYVGGGDFNALVGKKKDFSEELDDIKDREPLHSVTIKHGYSFINFLIGNSIFILNGSVPGDDHLHLFERQESLLLIIIEYTCLSVCVCLSV